MAKNIKSYDGLQSQKKRDLVFFWAMGIVPIGLFVIRYICVNLNSILYAFQSYDNAGRLYFSGFNNISQVLNDLTNEAWFKETLFRSVKLYFFMLLFTTPIPTFAAFFLFKKFPMSGFFKTILFLPTIISGLITAINFKFLLDRVIPYVALNYFDIDLGIGLLSNPDTRFGALLFQRLWFSIGSNLLVQIGAMNTTDKNTIDAGIIDGCSLIQEFWHIVLPACYQTIALGFVFGVGLIFTDDFGLYAFYGEGAPSDVWTLGYIFTVRTSTTSKFEYPYYSAWGALESFLIIPLTFILRFCVNRFGPSED